MNDWVLSISKITKLIYAYVITTNDWVLSISKITKLILVGN